MHNQNSFASLFQIYQFIFAQSQVLYKVSVMESNFLNCLTDILVAAASWNQANQLYHYSKEYRLLGATLRFAEQTAFFAYQKGAEPLVHKYKNNSKLYIIFQPLANRDAIFWCSFFKKICFSNRTKCVCRRVESCMPAAPIPPYLHPIDCA